MMRRLLILAALALAAPSSAQSVSPFPGVTVPVFGLPSVSGSNIQPATVGVDASTCAAPGIYLKTATTTGIAFTATPSVILCVNGTAILTSTASAVTTSTTILPATDAGLDFGTSSFRWRDVYVSRNAVIDTLVRIGGSVDLSAGAANRLDLATGDSWNLVGGGGAFMVNTRVVVSSTAPSSPVACTSPTVTNSTGTASALIDVGTSCAGISTLVVTLPAATNGWSCWATNTTTSATAAVEMTASTTTSATFTNYTRTTGVALAWADGADIRIGCIGG